MAIVKKKTRLVQSSGVDQPCKDANSHMYYKPNKTKTKSNKHIEVLKLKLKL